MSEVKLGTTPEVEVGYKDAIHIAVLSVTCNSPVNPGQNVGIEGENIISLNNHFIRIVDPFLKEKVKPGKKFWLLLYPNTITSLRHEWTHPIFEKEESVKYLQNVADQLGVSYLTLISSLITDNYKGSFRININNTELEPEIWSHLKITTGVDIPEEKRITFFKCAC